MLFSLLGLWLTLTYENGRQGFSDILTCSGRSFPGFLFRPVHVSHLERGTITRVRLIYGNIVTAPAFSHAACKPHQHHPRHPRTRLLRSKCSMSRPSRQRRQLSAVSATCALELYLRSNIRREELLRSCCHADACESRTTEVSNRMSSASSRFKNPRMSLSGSE